MQSLLDGVEGQVILIGGGVAVIALVVVGIIMMFTGIRKASEKLLGVLAGIILIGGGSAIVAAIMAAAKSI